ncbi:Gmad2 immunoglobulin-like domain-containing protein [Nocardioides sp. Kera G14]|uniref:Gmad2 immunoglobulin-like domain-containing protein n=1 Tax=Nocardioides sp. Kera G14 TaxID=2884264 RepID=UPI001D1120C1|nr:Gmad2 immunoglobulin-like domain-containing protein [Nocardioides sp. Kera G14]UDY24832.1 Gmad2 immunoglobulin-like domain-containing protein [Nocardioides sp. Kera G14]
MRNSTLRRTSFAAVALMAGAGLAACGTDDSTASDPETTAAASTSTPAAPATSESAAAPSSSAPVDVTPADALITLTAPTSGATVSGSFEAEGKANSPEANVPWSLTDGSGKVVAKGAFTAEGWMDKLYPYSGTVDLTGVAPGDYTFEVKVDDDSDGEGPTSSGSAVGVPITVK